MQNGDQNRISRLPHSNNLLSLTLLLSEPKSDKVLQQQKTEETKQTNDNFSAKNIQFTNLPLFLTGKFFPF